MWMITDFTTEDGATVIIPMSHKSRMHSFNISFEDTRICLCYCLPRIVVRWEKVPDTILTAIQVEITIE